MGRRRYDARRVYQRDVQLAACLRRFVIEKLTKSRNYCHVLCAKLHLRAILADDVRIVGLIAENDEELSNV